LVDASEFEALVRKDPLGALPVYERISSDPTVPRDVKIQRAESLRVALEEHGQQIVIQYLRGEQSPQTKTSFELGGRYFEEALRLAPSSTFDESRMLFCKGRALIFDRQESHYQEAERLLERAILLDPERSYAYNALGIAYLEQVRTHADYYARAVAAFDDARRFAPAWAYPMHNLALAYSEQGDFRSAERAYSQAMLLAPDYSYLPYNLALLYQRMNRLDDSEKLYRTALRAAEEARRSGVTPAISPWRERGDIWNGLGTVAAARHKEKAARDFYESALKDDPQLAAAKHNFAVLLSRRGPSTQAEQLWRENIAADANAIESRLALAQYLERNGEATRAIVEFEALIRVEPDQAGARRELAQLYSKAGRWEDAVKQLEAARAKSTNDPGILEELGDAAAKAGNRSEAESAYRDAERLYVDKRDRKRVGAKGNSQ
jgi:tetratricopeptide (TPR) repeat protein